MKQEACCDRAKIMRRIELNRYAWGDIAGLSILEILIYVWKSEGNVGSIADWICNFCKDV